MSFVKLMTIFLSNTILQKAQWNLFFDENQDYQRNQLDEKLLNAISVDQVKKQELDRKLELTHTPIRNEVRDDLEEMAKIRPLTPGEQATLDAANNPNMPAALQIETMTQVGGMILFYSLEDKPKYLYVRKITNAVFYRKIVPNTDIKIISNVIKYHKGIMLVNSKIKCNKSDLLYSKSEFSLINPDFKASNFKVVPFLCANLAILAALS